MSEQWWYLSFLHPERGWLGATVVRGDDIEKAAMEAWRHEANPGGEVLGLPLEEWQIPPEEFRGVLLSEADVASLDRVTGGEGEAAEWRRS